MALGNVLVALGGGLLAFLSPCFLPLIPAYLIYITGLSFEEVKNVRLKTFLHSLVFVLGFSLIFILLGLTAGAVGAFLIDYRDYLRIIGGGLIIFLGLYLLGALKLPYLDLEKKITLAHKPAGFLGTLLVGMTFALGWTPCVGPILAGILLLAGESGTAGQGVLLLTVFSLGLGLPLIIIALAVNSFLIWLKKIERFLGIIHKLSGLFLVLIGILLAANYWQTLSAWLIYSTGYKGI
jgi:cytochrome c-type biogenesis protein